MNKSNISPEEWVGSISVLKIDTPDFWYRNQRWIKTDIRRTRTGIDVRLLKKERNRGFLIYLFRTDSVIKRYLKKINQILDS